MMHLLIRSWLFGCLFLAVSTGRAAEPAPLVQPANTWVKRSPLKDAPVSPRLSYEASIGYDPLARRLIRWGGHAQGGVKGSGEQIAELWTLNPATMKWELKEPNHAPPAVCCAQQNVFDTAQNRFLRFKSFSGNHGWQWFREIYLNNSSVWSYDLEANRWRDRRPLPEPRIGALHCASWDSDHEVAVVFGGEGTEEGTFVYDPYTNVWTLQDPKSPPPPRSGGNMAYDAARKLHILFGSQFSNDPHTWAYDLAKNEWRDLKPATQPPTDRNDAVLAYDSVNKVIVAVVRVGVVDDKKEITHGRLETWAFDAGKNTWTQMKPEREPDGWSNRSRMIAYVPDQNLFYLEANINPAQRVPNVEREQQIWTYRFAEAKPNTKPKPPVALRVTTTRAGLNLDWQPSPSPDVTEYLLLRGEGVQPWLTDLKPIGRKKPETTLSGPELRPFATYHYAVRAIGKGGQESENSARVRTQYRAVEDVVVSVVSTKEVRLSWQPPPNCDSFPGYHVERAVVEVYSEDEILRLKKDTPPLAEPSVGAIKAIGPFQRISNAPLKFNSTSYIDASIDLTKPQTVKVEPLVRNRFRDDQLDPKGKPYRFAVYAYRIRAVDLLGVESGPSPYFLTIPSAPENLFSREDGERCQLKWTPNPETDMKGYRVYSMKGPRPEGPGQPTVRLTADPIAGNKGRLPIVQFVDEKAGSEVRRYWVVAVDAIGQEGIPSTPTWHYRTCRSFYEPFVGEWHQ